MKLELKVTFNDGSTKDVDAVFADFVAFERTWNKSVAKLDEDLRLTDIAWLAWHSLFRTHAVAIPFDPDWINTIELVGVREEGEIPLEVGQPTG